VTDRVLESFLKRQFADAVALTRDSDLVSVVPQRGCPPHCYVARFRCHGLVRDGSGAIVTADDFAVGITFGVDYLRHLDPLRTLTWLFPANVFHPNIAPPFICVGRLTPGTGLGDIVAQLHEMISWRKLTMREDDALNADACVFARAHPERFPVDSRPLRRRMLDLRVTAHSQANSA
jgi:hypothetical protein